MELMVACWRHRHGSRLWCDIPVAVVQRRQSVGTTGCLSVSVWHAQLLYHLYRLSCPTPALQMARTLPPLGSCRHLLAHRRFLFASNFDSTAYTRLLGMVAVLVCVAVCHRWHHRQFCEVARALQHRDILLHRHGPERAGGL